jgi:hypothetical protein
VQICSRKTPKKSIAVKKAIYILLIMSSMGFAVSPGTEAQTEPAQKRIIDHSAIKTGYLEVSSPASYSLTTGS